MTAACDEQGHPIDLVPRSRTVVSPRSQPISREPADWQVPIPKLCTLVVASAFDAALHDAYGKAFGRSCYETYGSAFMSRDLSHDLGPAFKGEYLDRYVPSKPRASTLVFHSVGASDPLDASDVRTRIDDGLPNTLEEWIPHDGLMRFKIKLNGGNLDADFERVVRIDRIVIAVQSARRRPGLEVLARFQRGLPERRVSAGIPPKSPRGHAARDSIESSTSSNRPRAICRKIART